MAVVDAVGLRQFALVGATDLGLCAMFAATFPERVTALEGERGCTLVSAGYPPADAACSWLSSRPITPCA